MNKNKEKAIYKIVKVWYVKAMDFMDASVQANNLKEKPAEKRIIKVREF